MVRAREIFVADIEQLPVYRSHYFRVRPAVSPVLGHFSAQLESPLNRKVLSARYRRGNYHSRHSDVFAQPFVAPFESFYLIIPPCGPPLSGREGFVACNTDCNNVSCVNACTKSLENWTSSTANRITERDGLDSFLVTRFKF